MLLAHVHNEKGSHHYVFAVPPQPQHHHQCWVLCAYPKSLLFVSRFSPAAGESKRQYYWNHKRDVDAYAGQHAVQVQ